MGTENQTPPRYYKKNSQALLAKLFHQNRSYTLTIHPEYPGLDVLQKKMCLKMD